MTSLTAYYDGTAFVPLEKVELEPNQKVYITIVDEKSDMVAQKDNATTLAELFKNNRTKVFSNINDPVLWQRKQRCAFY